MNGDPVTPLPEETMAGVWVYQRSEPGLWTVGHYTPGGKWIAESDHDTSGDAANRVNWLNGGSGHD